jgi:beta-phosphoglucomutase-like phosphatase (HAD superfamily)
MPTNASTSSSTIFRFKAVLWDMDGTLIDSEPIWIEQERALMQSLGVHWSDET